MRPEVCHSDIVSLHTRHVQGNVLSMHQGCLFSVRHAHEFARKLGARARYPSCISRPLSLPCLFAKAGLCRSRHSALGRFRFPCLPMGSKLTFAQAAPVLEDSLGRTFVEVTTCVEFLQFFMLWCSLIASVGSSIECSGRMGPLLQVRVLLLQAAP